MVKFKSTQTKMNSIKTDIKKGKKLNDFGDYECGCALNPYYGTLNRLCTKHSRMVEKN